MIPSPALCLSCPFCAFARGTRVLMGLRETAPSTGNGSFRPQNRAEKPLAGIAGTITMPAISCIIRQFGQNIAVKPRAGQGAAIVPLGKRDLPNTAGGSSCPASRPHRAHWPTVGTPPAECRGGGDRRPGAVAPLKRTGCDQRAITTRVFPRPQGSSSSFRPSSFLQFETLPRMAGRTFGGAPPCPAALGLARPGLPCAAEPRSRRPRRGLKRYGTSQRQRFRKEICL